jgi:hypothetical protein
VTSSARGENRRPVRTATAEGIHDPLREALAGVSLPRVEVERRVHMEYANRDIGPALAAANQRGTRWQLDGRLGEGGWGGAWRVRDAAGGVAVLKCVWDHDWRGRLASAARVVDTLYARGAPVPRFLASGHIPGVGTWYLQELIDGARVDALDCALVGDVVAFTDLQAGGQDSAVELFDWSAHAAAQIAEDPAGDLARAAGHDERLAVVAAWLAQQPAGRPVDLVHGDLLASQLLARNGRLAGVVDWDGAGRGERAQDLALLFYNAHAQADRLDRPLDDAVVEGLARAAIERTQSAAFGRYLAWEALQTVGFVLAHNTRHVEWRVSLALRTIARYGRLAGVNELARLPVTWSRP